MRSSLRFFALVALTALSLTLLCSPAAAGDIGAISFRDATTGYIGGGYTPDAWTRTGFASVTHDGGLTWLATVIPGTSVRGIDASPGGAFAVSEYFDWVLGYTDLGGIWQNTSAERVGSEASFYDVASRSGGRVVAVGERQFQGKVGVIATSEDGGATWTKAFEGPLYSPSGDLPAPSTYAAMSAVDVASDGTAWAVGNEWVSESTGSWTAQLVYKQRLVFRSLETTSAWTQITVPTGTGQRAMSAVAAVNSTTMWAFGAGGQYVMTTNGGETWTQGSLPVAMDVMGADARGGRIVVVGRYQTGLTTYQRRILTSLDDGATWSATTIAGSAPLSSVAMLSDTDWIAVGSNETIIRTSNAGTTWTGQTSAIAPMIAASAPSAGFGLSALPVTISGTAADQGVGVVSVEYRIRRSDGKCFNGTSWTDADAWLPAQTSDHWANWSASWSPDSDTLGTGLMVTITARATDALGAERVSADITSGLPASASAAISLNGGARYTTTAVVSASVAATGATQMRWRVDSEAPTGWKPCASTEPVLLTSGDGTKTVTFEFSTDGVSVVAAASDTIVLDGTKPAVKFTNSALCFSRSTSQLRPSGIASDTLSGLVETRVNIMRNGLHWDHMSGAWVAYETWIPTTALGTPGAWSYVWTLDAATKAGSTTATITVESEDAAGNITRVSTIARPKTRAYVTAPPLPAAMYRTRTYSVYGYLKPQHAIGKYAAMLRCYRYQRLSSGKYAWVLKLSVKANAASYQKYYARLRLPYAGKWRVYAYHYEDATHVTTRSSTYRAVTVK